MDKIYIAVAYGGSYEDVWETNLAASFNQEKINSFVNEKVALVERVKAASAKLGEFATEYERLNMFDRSRMDAQKEVPKWPAGIDQRLITKEMRAERESIRAYNAAVISRNHKRMMDHNDRRNEAMVAFLMSIGFDFKDLSGEEPFSCGVNISTQIYRVTSVSYRVDEVDAI